MSAMIVRAPAASSSSPELGAGVAAADETDGGHAGGRGGGDAGGRILDHDAFGRLDAHSRSPRARTGPAPACRSARRWRRTGSARRTAPARWSRGWPGCGPCVEEDATHFGPRSQVSAWATCGMARNSARMRRIVAAATVAPKFVRQLALGHGLDRGEHVGRPAAEEIAAHQLGRDRHAGAREFLRRNRRRDLLAVNEHAVAIEDDHGCPPRPVRVCTLRSPTNH